MNGNGNGSLAEAFEQIAHGKSEQKSFEEYVREELKHLRDIGKKTGEALDLILAHYGLELEKEPDGS